MEASIWTSYLIDLSPEEMVKQFAGRKWRRLELSTEHSAALVGRGDPAGIGKKFKRFAAGHGVSFPQGHLWLQCDVAARNQRAVLDILKRWLDLYVAIGIRAAVIHPGGKEMEKAKCDPKAILAAQVRGFRALARHVKGTGLTLCLENVIQPGEIRRLMTIIESCGCGGLGICLDTGHLNLAEGDQISFIRTAGPLLRAVHLADNNGKTDQHLMPYGSGTVRWNEVGPGLMEMGFKGAFNFEVPGECRCPLAVRLAKLDYLKAILPSLIAGEYGRTK